MRHHLPGLHIPDAVERRLRGVPADRVGEEGLRLCAEITRQVREIPGVAGVHLMAVGRHEIVSELLDRAGVTPRDLAGTAAAGEGGSRAG
jgi:methylenetetrahydrofolate reductase (NADPH)